MKIIIIILVLLTIAVGFTGQLVYELIKIEKGENENE